MPNNVLKANRYIYIISAIVFIDFLGIGLVVPVMPSIIMGIATVTVEKAATIASWLIFTYALMQLLFAPIIGNLSDRFGRKPVLIFSLLALSFNYALMALAPTLFWLFLGRMISGIFGATWPAAASCIADITEKSGRAKAMGILGASSAAGYIFAPGIGGLLGRIDPRLPFLTACVFALLTAATGLLSLKETLPVQSRRKLSLSQYNPLRSLIQISQNRPVALILTAYFFMHLSTQAQLSIWPYYGIEKFGWDSLQIGLTIMLFGILFVFVQLVLTDPIVVRTGEFRTAWLSVFIGIPTYLIFAFAESTPAAIGGIVVGSMTALAQPTLQSLMMGHTQKNNQGQLQGTIASVASLSTIIGAPSMAAIFAEYSGESQPYLPGAPFLLSAFMVILSLAALSTYNKISR